MSWTENDRAVTPERKVRLRQRRMLFDALVAQGVLPFGAADALVPGDDVLRPPRSSGM